MYVETDMCGCFTGWGCTCGIASNFCDTHTTRFHEWKQIIDGEDRVYLPTLENTITEEMKTWNIHRLGYPPNARPMLVDADNTTGFNAGSIREVGHH